MPLVLVLPDTLCGRTRLTTDMSDFSKVAFSSAFRYERVATKGNKAFSVGAFGVTTYTVAHSLGYFPYYKAWYTYGDGKYFKIFAGTASFGIDGNGGQVDNVNVDNNNLNITISENSGGTISGTIYYRIYAEPQV